MEVIIILIFLLIFWCLLSYLFNIRNIVISYIYLLWKENKFNILQKIKISYKYIVIITALIVILLLFLNEKWAMTGILILIGLGYYFICYKVMFEKKFNKGIEKNIFKHMYKFNRSINNGKFSLSILFIIYSLYLIIIVSIINVLLPWQIGISIISGNIDGLLSYLSLFILLNIFILPPLIIKLFTCSKRKRDLSINIIKSLLTIIYGFVVVYISLTTIDMSNNMKLIPILLYMVLLSANIFFIFIDIIDYYKEKLQRDN
ncbi:hypothetical protein K1Y15_06570 [Mammaliicoccus sciuri]|uniref:hypothetical protein n=1 Tax=Mammaliicoccus sciuri TaxID=1296 RepID=UPI001E34A6F2|nr:hypothetical protein [Mammaliicoccus sciuri]MCD8788839.1 hypothetical protein [Mammaliicoccus sciuri]